MTLKEWRTANRYTLPAFAKLLLEAGKLSVTPRTIHNWEIGYCLPSLEKVEAIRLATKGKVKVESFRRA